MLTVLRRLFDFSSWETNHPGSPPPGDWLDASFDAQNQRIAELESLLDSVRRSDGRLQNGIVSKDSLDPDFFVQLSAKITQIGELLLENARLERQNAENAAQVALFAKNTAEEAKQRVLAAESAAEPFHSTLQTGLQTLSEQVEIARTAASQAVAALDVVTEMESHAGYSEAWADSSQAWAEHMPDTIPDNYLHDTDVSGDHWSSRWWANQAAHSFGRLVELYLGVHADPPTTSNSGGPINPGSIYYDSDDGRAYVWTGTAWVPLWTPAQTTTLSLWYVATAAQTAFPTSTPDINGNSFVLDNANPEGVEVHVNGLLREPDLSGPGGDYTVNAGTSTITFNAGLAASDRVCIDVMTSLADIRPGAMNAWAMTVAPAPDGVMTSFTVDVIDASGPATATVVKAEELLVSVDGVVQKPGDDYQASGATLTFSTAPSADSIIFATWFQALGGSPTGDMTPAEILAAIKTVDGPASGIDADLLDGQHGAFYAPIASPTFTGDPKAPTPLTADNDTSIATTAFVVAKLASVGVGAPPTWADITGKPATFPYATPIPQADVANLTTDLAGKLNDTGDTMTGVLSMPATGSAATATINFGGANTGIYGSATTVRMSTSGSERVTLGSSFQTTVPVRTSSGTVGAPGFSFSGDTNSGLYLVADGDIRLSMNGADVVKWLDDKSTTFSGDVTITETTAQLNLNKTAGNTSQFNFQSGGSTRWTFESSSAAESGSNAGATFTFKNCADNGTPLTNVFAVTRSTGAITFANAATFTTTVAITGLLTAMNTTAIPAGGANTAGIKLSSTANFGVFFGSGAPTLTAAQGSIYLRSDGADNNTRFYVNNNGTTGWTALSAVAVGTSAPGSPATGDVWIDTT